MNCCVPEFEFEEDSCSSIFTPSVHRIPDSTGEELVELLWQKGPVFRLISQQTPHAEFAIPSGTTPSASGAASYTAVDTVAAAELFMEEDEMASWLNYPLGDDDRGAGIGGDYLSEKTQSAAAVERPPPPPPPPPPETQWKLALFPRTREPAAVAASLPPLAPRETTVVDSSVTPELARGRAPESRVSTGGGRGETGTWEHGVTSSSGVICEGEEAAKMAARTDDHKRKAPEGDDSDYHSEDAEFEYSDKKEDTRRSTSKRRSRAAEVHNLSERRRRDRINEKMKTLQELIPRCNKSDKASMLDDAIEYLKSLQMQVQMMSMGCNMVPMMFPGIQQYMAPVGMAMPMGMNMGMGLGMGMEMGAGTLNHHPMMPFLPVMSSPHVDPTGAAPLSQRLPMQPFHAPAVGFSDQTKFQGSSQTSPASNLACVGRSHAQQTPNHAQQHIGFHHSRVHTQIRANPKQRTSRGTSMSEKFKTG